MIRAYLQGLRARRIAEDFCYSRQLEELVLCSSLCASEADRFVVRVFCGHREMSGATASFGLPPWAVCHIVAVDKTTGDALLVVDDARYRPILR